MQTLPLEDESIRLFQELAQAKRRVLLVDYDTVIAPLAATQNSPPYPNVIELLDCIMTTGRTRVVLITGRRASDLPPLPGPRADIWTAGGIQTWTIESLKTEGFRGPILDDEIVAMLSGVGDDAAVAYLSERSWWCISCGAFHAGDESAGGERLVQFLVDWLRVCGGEIC